MCLFVVLHQWQSEADVTASAVWRCPLVEESGKSTQNGYLRGIFVAQVDCDFVSQQWMPSCIKTGKKIFYRCTSSRLKIREYNLWLLLWPCTELSKCNWLMLTSIFGLLYTITFYFLLEHTCISIFTLYIILDWVVLRHLLSCAPKKN